MNKFLASLAPVRIALSWFSQTGSVRTAEALSGASQSERLYVRLFWGWLISRTALWTIVSCVVLSNPPMDTVEMLSWGQHWQWCYHKHPPMPAWIAEAAVAVTGGAIGAVYLASNLLIGICMWCAWRLGRDMLSPRLGFFAALCLEPLDFYNQMAQDIGHGVALAAASALLTLCCHRALVRGGWQWWVALGVAAGAAFLSKYSAGFLFIPMLLFAMVHPRCRAIWKQPGPYITIGVATLVVLPHLIACIQDDFGPIRYFVGRSYEKESSWLNHLWFPISFIGSQALHLLPVLLSLAPLVWPWRWRSRSESERFNRDFLLAIVMGPIALHILVAGVLGVEVREMWGHHLWTFLGLVVLFFWQVHESPRRFVWAGLIALLGSIGFLAAFIVPNAFGPTLFGKACQSHFPGESIAAKVAEEWSSSQSGPLPIIASDELFLGCSAAWYSEGRPATCMLIGRNETPWATDDDLNRRGGVILWHAYTDDNRLPECYQKRFPTAQSRPQILVTPNRGPNLPPRRIGIAIVPPAGK